MPSAKEISDAYDRWKDENPKTKRVVDLMPGVGVVTAAADTVQDLYKGSYGDAALDALGAIPALGGAKLLKMVKAKRTAQATEKAAKAYAKGGRVTGYRGYGKAKKV